MITPLNFLGNISYSLYLTHVLVYIVISGILKKLAINVDADPVPWLLVKVVFAIIDRLVILFSGGKNQP